MSLLAADANLQPNITLIVVASVLVAAGVYLLLERSLTRVLLGIVLMSNGVATLYLVVSGRARGAPLLGERPPEEMSDPLPQAFVLTAIVISLATVAFVMALAYRYWRLTGSDDVPDDLEDALILRLAERDQPSETYDADVTSTTAAEEDPEEAEARDAAEKARNQAAAGRGAAELAAIEEPAELDAIDEREPGIGPAHDVVTHEVVPVDDEPLEVTSAGRAAEAPAPLQPPDREPPATEQPDREPSATEQPDPGAPGSERPDPGAPGSEPPDPEQRTDQPREEGKGS